MRGFFGGLVIGLATLVVGFVALSLLSPATPRPEVSDGAPQSVTGTEQPSQQSGVRAASADNDLIELAPNAPGSPTGGNDNLAMLSDADTDPGEKPSVGKATPDLAGPGATPQAPEINVNPDAPVISSVPVGELNTPQASNQPTALAGGDTDPGEKPSVGKATPDLTGPGAMPKASDINVNPDAPMISSAPVGELNTPQVGNQPTALAGGETSPGKRPSVGSATAGLTGPAIEKQAPGLNAGEDAPVAFLAPSGGLTAPSEESKPAALAEPATPTVADVSKVGPGFGNVASEQGTAPKIAAFADPAPSPAPVAGDMAALSAGLVPDADTAPDPSTKSAAEPEPQSGPAPVAEIDTAGQDTRPEVSAISDIPPATKATSAEPQAPQAEQMPDPSTRTAALAVPQTGPKSVPVPEVEPSAPSGPATPASPRVSEVPAAPAAPSAVTDPAPNVDKTARVQPTTPARTQDPSNPQFAALPQAGTGTDEIRPRIGQRIVPLTERNVVEKTGDKVIPTSETTAATDSDIKMVPPIKANSAAFENPENRPLMAIVLIDDEQSLGGEALAEFPYPLSFAVDPSDPEAAAKMARHRAAGFEVVLLTDLATQATAQDAEVSLAVWLNALPDVVALLEGPGTGIQGNRDLTDQVTAIVSEAGLGLIMRARGLNTSFKLAARDGVPAALLFRDFDGAGQKPVVMRRFLDQAAFRAGQQGGVIMLGRLRPETISALLIWGLQDRVSRVTLAPVSAVLTQSR